jgi:phenylalanyl-tRNA synthetase beta chain
MKFTLSWLKDHLETDATLDEIVERLTNIGLEVEESTTRRGSSPSPSPRSSPPSSIPTPTAARAVVDTGDGKPVQVVCGAPNARAGLSAPSPRPAPMCPAST